MTKSRESDYPNLFDVFGHLLLTNSLYLTWASVFVGNRRQEEKKVQKRI